MAEDNGDSSGRQTFKHPCQISKPSSLNVHVYTLYKSPLHYGSISCIYVCWSHSLCICVMCTVLLWHTCPCCLSPRCPSIQIDAVDLIKPDGLHVECQHCHQAQLEPNVGIGGIDPVDSTASSHSRNQRPLQSKTMILSWDPPLGGKKGWRWWAR